MPEERLATPITAAAAVERIAPGSRVYVAAKGGTPVALLDALARRGTPDVELFYFLLDAISASELVTRAPQIKHRPLYVGEPLARQAVGDSVSYVPLSLPEACALIASRRLAFDAAMVATSLPDAQGRVSLGTAVGMTPAVLRRVSLAIAEQVPAMPVTAGDSFWAADAFSAVVVCDRALPEFRHERDDARSGRIGRYVSRLIEDGATLQVGPGRVPNGALRFLTDRHDLRILTDLLSEELSALVESGAVRADPDGAPSPGADPDVMASFCTGTAQLFARLNRNPRYTFWPIEVVTDEARLRARPRMVSITQALAIDLTGQACCDRISETLFGGLGSQPEYMQAAARAPGGKPILCLYATDNSGTSNVHPALGAGEAVTIPRSDVHFVVTEFGIAYLHGKSIEERALALIEVAHPDHRPWLLDEARTQGLIAAGYSKLNRDAYGVEDERRVRSKGGAPVTLRPARLSDVPSLQRLVHHCSREDLYLRFFRYLRSLSIEEAVRLCTGSQGLDAVFVAVVGERESERLIASACFFGEATTRLAEVGYLVDPEWQRGGLGRELQTLLIAKARALGFRGLRAQVFAHNTKMLRLAKSSGLQISLERDREAYEILMTW
ncbi:MAG: GNAT family N-acetyltransferase [Gammaproteobacteria bacterium]